MNILERAALLPEDKWTLCGKDYYLPSLFTEVFGITDYLSLEWGEQKNFPLDYVWVNTHVCTDTQVGKKIYRYKGVMFAVTQQEYRKTDEELFVINKKVLKECIADFRDFCQDEDMLEVGSDDPILESCGYFMLSFSSEALTKKAYFLPEGVEGSTDNLIPCTIVRKGFKVESYADGFEIKLEGEDDTIITTTESIFFKEFEGC